MLDVSDGADGCFLDLVRHKRADNPAEKGLVFHEKESDEHHREQTDAEGA